MTIHIRSLPTAAALILLSATFCIGRAEAADSPQYFVHTAKDGDTLIGLASRYLVMPNNWQPLQNLNKIADATRIRPGTPIRIPLADMKTDAATVSVVALSGPVESSAGKLTPGTALGEGANVKTGDNGFVTLRLADGSTMVVQSKSQVKLEIARTIANTGGVPITRLGLTSGRVEAQVRKRDGAAGRFEIATPTSNMGVRGTSFRVSADAAGKSSGGEVVEGIVAVTSTSSASNDTPLDLAAGYGTIIESGKLPLPPVQLLAAPNLRDAPSLQERILLRFKFAPLAGATSYRAQVAVDREFTQLRAETTFASPEAKFGDLADGNFFLRVRAVDKQGIEGGDAVLPFKLKARPEPPFTSVPANKDKFAATQVEFKWSNATEADNYRLQLASDAAFTKIISDDRGIKGTSFKAPGAVKPGDYFWRVASIRADGDVGPLGDAQSFTLKAMPAAPNPPKEDGGRVTFTWGGEAGQKFDFQLARDAKFTNLVSEKRLDNPEITLDKPSEAGIYYMRFRAIDPDGFVGPYSSAQTIEVKSTKWYALFLLLPFLL